MELGGERELLRVEEAPLRGEPRGPRQVRQSGRGDGQTPVQAQASPTPHTRRQAFSDLSSALNQQEF